MIGVLNMIRIDYDDTIQKANIIRALSEDVNRLTRQFSVMMASTNNHWRGLAANAYLKQCGELKDSMDKTSREMQLVAEVIKQTASEIKAADMPAEPVSELIPEQ